MLSKNDYFSSDTSTYYSSLNLNSVIFLSILSYSVSKAESKTKLNSFSILFKISSTSLELLELAKFAKLDLKKLWLTVTGRPVEGLKDCFKCVFIGFNFLDSGVLNSFSF